MQYELKAVKIAPDQHPGFVTLNLLAEVDVDFGGAGKPKSVVIPIIAEPDRWKDKFTCRIYRWSSADKAGATPAYVLERDFQITGLGSVPGLKEQARATTIKFWDSGFLPGVPVGTAGSMEGTLIPQVVSSTMLRLRFDELKLGNFEYAGEITVRELETGELQGTAPRHSLHVLLGALPSGGVGHHSLNEKASRTLIAYLLPRAKQSWQALKLERNAKKIDELKYAIDGCRTTISNAQHELDTAKAALPLLEAELKKVTEA